MKPQQAFDAGKAIGALARAGVVNPEMTLRAAGGATVTKELRDELLAKCMAGEYVELELEVLAFEQRPGVQNRNFIRFRDGALMALGRSGVGTPFMRDHDQWDSMAVGGRVIESATEKRGDGDYAIRQKVKLSAPWAVEMALRGLLNAVSIGWNPTAMVQCSVCQLDFYRCSHYPGQRYVKDGTDETVVCEAIYTAAELKETSAVPIPAVPEAHIEAIRAALAANDSGEQPHGRKSMNPELIALLSLAATAGANEENVIAAVKKLKSEATADRSELTIVKAELAMANSELATFRAAKRQADEDKFVGDALAQGKIGTADEVSWRGFYQASPERASAEMAKRAVGQSTPVGVPRASATVPVDPKPVGNEADAAIAAAGGDPVKVRAGLRAAGLSEAEIDKQLNAMIRKVG